MVELPEGVVACCIGLTLGYGVGGTMCVCSANVVHVKDC